MGGDASGSPEGTGRRYEAILRLSEALSRCQEPEDLTEILSEELREFLTFLQFYFVVYKENSTEVEWAVLGREKNQIASYANAPVQQRPSWQAPLSLAIRSSDVSRFEQAAIAPLPIGDGTFRIAIAAPEEVARIGTRYTEDGLLEIDNSAAERALRAVALGRKNFLFVGSDPGGERAAAMYSLIGSAKLNELDPELYLRTVLAQIADHPVSKIHDLLPRNLAPFLHTHTSEAT